MLEFAPLLAFKVPVRFKADPLYFVCKVKNANVARMFLDTVYNITA